jgi:hypothetical protein
VSSLAIALIVFGCAFACALIGMAVRLPDHHRDQDSKDVVKLVMGLIATIAALVLGLLIASANSSYNVQRSELQSLSGNVILLDRLLVAYGPEAKEVRDRLRESVQLTHEQIWSPNGAQPMALDRVPGFIVQLQSLSPKTDAQRSMQNRIVELGETLVQTRLLMFEQLGGAILWPVLTVLVFWICILFLGFGIFTRPNVTLIAALSLGALSVSGALFLILELSNPYSGLLQISDTPLRNALVQLGR